MHRADPFMLDEEIAEADEVPVRPALPPSPSPARPPEQRAEPVAPVPPVAAPQPAPARPAPPPAPAITPVSAPVKKAAKRGRPKSANPKRQITLRLDAEIIEHYKAKGRGWQTRINSALREAAGL